MHLNVSIRPKVFQNFFLGKQLSQTADESAVCVYLRFTICEYLKIYARYLYRAKNCEKKSGFFF